MALVQVAKLAGQAAQAPFPLLKKPTPQTSVLATGFNYKLHLKALVSEHD